MKLLARVILAATPIQSALATAGELIYNAIPEEVWRKPFNSVGQGNGVFIDPLGEVLAVVTQNGRVRAYDILDEGRVLWTYSPEPVFNGTLVRCQSNMRFFEKDSQSLMAYAVIDDVYGGTISTRVLVLSMDGTIVFESTSLVGESTASLQVTSDGRYIALTHNDNFEGYFSLLDTDLLVNGTLSPLYQYKSELIVYNETTPFSDLGYFSHPAEGFYDDLQTPANGNLNNNDLFMWMTDTNTMVTHANGDPLAGDGQMYVFQFPRNYDHSGVGLEVIPIGLLRGYQSPTRPIIANQGRSMYWGMVRGETRAWVSRRFSRGHTDNIKLGRGSPSFVAPRAPPTLSNGGTNGDPDMVFGVGASNLVWKASNELGNLTTVPTDDIVTSQVLVTADDEHVLYATVSGTLTMASTTNLTTEWQIGGFTIYLGPVQGEIALNPSGTIVYLATNNGASAGEVVALRIAREPPMPSETPSETPTASPSAMPSATPSSSPTASPTSQPTAQPTSVQSQLPTALPSQATQAPVRPSSQPSIGPTQVQFLSTNTPTLRPTTSPNTEAPQAAPSNPQSARIEEKQSSAEPMKFFGVALAGALMVLSLIM